MRENRLHGSEGGKSVSSSRPLSHKIDISSFTRSNPAVWALVPDFSLEWRKCITQPDIAERLALPASQAASSILLVLLAVAALWVIFGVERPEITAMAGTGAPSNPLNKTVQAVGAD